MLQGAPGPQYKCGAALVIWPQHTQCQVTLPGNREQAVPGNVVELAMHQHGWLDVTRVGPSSGWLDGPGSLACGQQQSPDPSDEADNYGVA